MVRFLEAKSRGGICEATLRLTTDQALRLYRHLMNDRGGVKIEELQVSEDEFDHNLTVRLSCQSPPDDRHNPLHDVIAHLS